MLTRRQLLLAAGATAASSLLPATTAAIPKADVADLIKALEAGERCVPPVQPSPLRINEIDLSSLSAAAQGVAANRIKSVLYQFNRVLPKRPLTQARIEQAVTACITDFQNPVRLWVGPKTLSDYNLAAWSRRREDLRALTPLLADVRRATAVDLRTNVIGFVDRTPGCVPQMRGLLELKAATPKQFWSDVSIDMAKIDPYPLAYADNPGGQPIPVPDYDDESIFAMEMADGSIRHFPEESCQPVVRTVLPMIFFNRVVHGPADKQMAETARIFGDLVDRGVIGYGALAPPSWLDLACPECIQAMEDDISKQLAELCKVQRIRPWDFKTTMQAKMVLPDNEKVRKAVVPGLQNCPHGGHRGVFFYAAPRIEWIEKTFGDRPMLWPRNWTCGPEINAEAGGPFFQFEGHLGEPWVL